MTLFTNRREITWEIQDRLAAAIRAEHWGEHELFISLDSSGQSASRYIDVRFEIEDDCTDAFCIRISDHEARSYNRTGDFNIDLGLFADTHVILRAEDLVETVVTTVEIEDVDDDGNPFIRFGEEVEDEFRGVDLDAAEIDAAVEQGVAALRRFFTRETEA